MGLLNVTFIFTIQSADLLLRPPLVCKFHISCTMIRIEHLHLQIVPFHGSRGGGGGLITVDYDAYAK